ncbi:MAG: glycosyltransferase [Patescibacteria group bacterium]|nr:glycosyltransferase [Patescibacteria group bacterium]
MIALLLKYKQIIKYLIAGGTATLTDLCLLYFFTDILDIWYLLSAVLAFSIAFFVSFFLQKFWTFRDPDKEAMYKQMVVYFGVCLTNLVINTVLMYVFVDFFKIWYMLAQVIISGLIACESYLIYKFFIFNKNIKSEEAGKIKILIATGIYPPDFRGPATMLEALPKSLEKNGFSVKLITYSDIKTTPEERGRIFRILRQGPGATRHLKYFLTMLKLSLEADFIYCTDTYSVGYFCYLIKKMIGKKYIVRFAGDSAWETALRLGVTADYLIDFQKKTYTRPIEKLKARRAKIMVKADKVIAVSKFLARVAALIGVKEDRIKLIYNSIDFINENYDEDKIRRVRGQFGPEAKIIISAGQLNPWKGFDGIIRGLSKIEKEMGDNVHFLILGEGQEMENLKKLAHDLGVEAKVHFLGKIDHGEIMNYFRAGDLFILNSHYEGQSHTLLEVMKAGTPIIASNIEANQEVIEDNKNGILVKYNSAEEISSAVVRILNDKTLADNFVSQGREKLKIFNWDNTVKLTLEAIREII